MSAQDPVAELDAMLDACARVVGFTGAGISTESGIPDYRSQGGLWSRYQPVYFDDFLRDPSKRRLYWERTLAMWPTVRDARPNRGHDLFVRLHRAGKLRGLITQNIDGLHERSGIPTELIVNLHGSALWVVCLACGRRVEAGIVVERTDLDRGVPQCEACGGVVKPATISFGQQLRPEDLERAGKLARNCDLMLAMGSTLLVQPAATFPASAKESGARLVIVTLSETPLDDMADLVLRMPIGELAERLVTRPS